MSKLKVIIVIILSITLLSCGFLFIKKEMFKKESNPISNNEITEIVPNIQENDNSETSNDNIQEIEDEVKEEVMDNKGKNNNIEPKPKPKQETKKETSKQITNSSSTTNDDKAVEETKEETRQQTPWESLGISEYDYYNKPMWSWARIDYSVKEYGSLEKTHQACIDYGNSLEDITSFSCTNINSYSGDYLGDMLKTR